MEKTKREEIRKSAGKIAEIREGIYESMPSEFSIEALAKSLKPHCGNLSDEEIIGEIEALKAGMADGAKRFDGMYEKYVEKGDELDPQALLKQKTAEMLKGLSEAQQRTVWYSILDGLREGEDEELYTADMSTDELEEKACALLIESCRAEADEDILNAIEDARQGVESVEFKEHEERFSEEERRLIDAAAAYTVMKRSGGVDAEQFGGQFAFQQRAVERMIKNEKLNIALKVISIVSLAAATFAVGCAICALFHCTALLPLLFPMLMTALICLSLPGVIPDLIEGYSELPDKIYNWLTERPFIARFLFEDCEETRKEVWKKKREMAKAAKEYGRAEHEQKELRETEQYGNITQRESGNYA